MKLRRTTDDFRVDEESSLPIGSSGKFGVYRLCKRGWTTLDALDRLSRMLHIERHRLTHAGLKDRHAVTTQLITIAGGQPQSDELDGIRLEFLGRSSRAIRSDDIRANAFQITLRSLDPAVAQRMESAVLQVARWGLPNYFDNQRFGSWIPGHGFAAVPWLRSDYESAVRILLAEFSPDDDAAEREQKAILQEHWGDWTTCKARLSKSHRRSIITFMDDRKGDFKGAWARVNADWRGLALSALQSHLWNQIGAAVIRSRIPGDRLTEIHLKPGSLPVPLQLSGDELRDWRDLRIPLPSARMDPPPESIAPVIQAALAESGWSVADLKVRHPRDRFFSRALRPLWLLPDDLSGQRGSDDLDPPREKLTLRFALPRGAYATMVIKQLLSAAGQNESPPDELRSEESEGSE